MTRIETSFDTLKKENKKGFIPYICAGDPSLEDTLDIVLRLEDAGADIIEIGIPFSDPLADGVANQLAQDRALAAGTTVSKVFEWVQKIRNKSEVPLVLYSYLNPLHQYGFDAAAKDAADVGADGMLLVDLSIIEAQPYRDALKKVGLNNISLVTPTTPETRIREIVEHASGFVYTVSRAGVTGEQTEVQKDAQGLLERVHHYTDLPVALGFGVSTPEQAATYAKMTEAVVVGSFIVNTLHQAGEPKRAAAMETIKTLIDAVKAV